MPTPTNAAAIMRWILKEIDPGYPDPYLRHPWLFSAPGRLVSGDGAFPLVETVFKSRGNGIECFLLNGDLGRSRNTNHQWVVRGAMGRMSGDTPQRRWDPPFSPIPFFPDRLIVPFSALDAASIDRSTIRPIEIREDRWDEIEHEIEPYDKNQIKWDTRRSWQNGRIKGRPELRFQRNWDGKSERNFHAYFRNWAGITHREDGSMFVRERRHWLGDSVFRAKVNGRYRTFVSSFDYQERRPLYFLAEVPSKALVKSVEDAILALSPPIVHAAVAQGREVKRQGDMFAIPTGLTTRDIRERTGAQIQRMQGVLGTDHVATESIVGKGRATYARGFLHHRPELRRSDHQSVNLGKDWHLMVPNAVPRRARGLAMNRLNG